MPFLQLRGVSLHYTVTGRGAPLVLIGGLGMPLQGWALQVKSLSRIFQLIRFDNRGCGASSIPHQSFSIQDMANDVIALLDHLNLENAHILGLSMGGFIALELAAMAPHRVRSLVLAHTTAKLPIRTKHRLRLWTDMRQAAVPSSIMAREQLLWIFPERILQNDSTVEMLIKNMILAIESQSPEGFKGQVEACERFDILEKLPEITAPALIVCAADDLSAPLSHANYLKQLRNVLKFKIFSSAGHVSHLVDAEEFNHDVSDFIQSIDFR